MGNMMVKNSITLEKYALSEYIRRRIEFVLDEVIHSDKKDQVIDVALRQVSNYITVGMLGDSRKMRESNKLISEQAFNILKTRDSKLWGKTTTNEHPQPIKQTWDWLVDNAGSVSVEEAFKELHKTRMVTVTKKEDAKLTQRGLRSKGSIECRYNQTGISVFLLSKTPTQILKDDMDEKIDYRKITLSEIIYV